MTYVISVGGDPINPNPFTYSQISMTGNITLYWPFNNQSSTYTATNWVDVTSSAAYTITMPNAREAADGQEVVFNNYGSFTVTINTSDGTSITTVASGEAKRIWVTDNSSTSGSWRISNIGSGTTQADASMLAGYGLIAQAGQLSQSMPVSTYGTSATITTGLRAYLALWIGGSGTFTMSSPATLGSNWFFNVKNAGSGTLTIDGSGSDIDGSPTIDVTPGEGFCVTTDGVEFYTTGRISPNTQGLTYLNKSLGSGGSTTLTSAEAAYNIINFTGSLSTDATVNVPAAVAEWVMINNTTGTSYTTTIKTSGGTGVTITQGTQRILYCDGTDVDYADAVGTGTVTSVASGTGLAGGPITTSGTLYIANTSVVAGSYGSAATVATFTVNAQGQLTTAASVAISIGSDNINTTIPVNKGGTGQTSLTANYVILGNGTGAVQVIAPGTSGNALVSNGTTWTSGTPSIAGGISYRNVITTVTSNTAWTVTADSILLEDSSGNTVRRANISLAGAITTSGANGLDTGSEASNTWYSVWAIYNPSGATDATLLSTSATSPTLPSGYTYKARTSWIRNDNSSNLFRTIQKNTMAQYVVGTNPSTSRAISTGSAGTNSDTAPTWSSQAWANYFPSTTSEGIFLMCNNYNNAGLSVTQIAPNGSYAGILTTNPPYHWQGAAENKADIIRMLLESSNVSYVSSGSGGALFAAGWIDNL